MTKRARPDVEDEILRKDMEIADLKAVCQMADSRIGELEQQVELLRARAGGEELTILQHAQKRERALRVAVAEGVKKNLELTRRTKALSRRLREIEKAGV